MVGVSIVILVFQVIFFQPKTVKAFKPHQPIFFRTLQLHQRINQPKSQGMVVLQGSLYMTPNLNKARLYKKDTSQKDYLLDLYQVWSFLWPLIFFGASFHSVFIATNCNHPIFLGLFIHDLSTNIQPVFPPSIRGTNSESVRPRYGVEVVVVDTSETFPSSEVMLVGSGVVVTWWIPVVGSRFKAAVP